MLRLIVIFASPFKYVLTISDTHFHFQIPLDVIISSCTSSNCQMRVNQVLIPSDFERFESLFIDPWRSLPTRFISKIVRGVKDSKINYELQCAERGTLPNGHFKVNRGINAPLIKPNLSTNTLTHFKC